MESLNNLLVASVGASIGLTAVSCYFMARIVFHKFTDSLPWAIFLGVFMWRGYVLIDALKNLEDYATAINLERIINSFGISLGFAIGSALLWMRFRSKYYG